MSLQKIEEFIGKHHVLTLATYSEELLSACSVFYAYDSKTQSFIFASDAQSEHGANMLKSKDVAANVLLETEEIGKIQGLQIKGKATLLEEKRLNSLYFKSFPYARVLSPQLWQLKVQSLNLTDNRLGFDKKLTWKVP